MSRCSIRLATGFETVALQSFELVDLCTLKLDRHNSQTFVECCRVNNASKRLVHYKHNSLTFGLGGQWWWSSGQRARLLLRRSEFESRWSLQFLFCKLFEKNENKQTKMAGDGPFKKTTWAGAVPHILLKTLRQHHNQTNI